MEFEVVIGLEVHAQLKTNSKIFCGSPTAFGAAPNQHVDPLTFGFPGSLPVLNRKVVEFAIMLGLATNCEIRRYNRFARKHYFYPDLPKGYQISQYDEPICERGHIAVRLDNVVRTIGITRIHMEEDAGKNIHDARTQCSLVDYNRAGVPLLEIVSEPDMRSAAEAAAYMRTMRQIVRHLDICDGNMEEGSLRCDANVSLRPVGTTKFGTKTEIKNINSFKFLEQAIEYEIARQLSIIKGGGSIIQETRLFDSTSGTTKSMRTKEGAADYRYLPDPDLTPLVVEDSWIAEVRARMPRLPEEQRQELIDSFGLSAYDADLLTQERSFIEFFQKVFAICSNAKLACNWITSELFGYLNKEGIDLARSPVSADQLGELIKLIDGEVISGKMAKAVFEEMFKTGKSAQVIVDEKGLKQVTNPDQIRTIALDVIAKSKTQVADYLAGQDRLFGFFVGQVMKATQGTANPKLVNDIIKQELDKLKSS